MSPSTLSIVVHADMQHPSGIIELHSAPGCYHHSDVGTDSWALHHNNCGIQINGDSLSFIGYDWQWNYNIRKQRWDSQYEHVRLNRLTKWIQYVLNPVDETSHIYLIGDDSQECLYLCMVPQGYTENNFSMKLEVRQNWSRSNCNQRMVLVGKDLWICVYEKHLMHRCNEVQMSKVTFSQDGGWFDRLHQMTVVDRRVVRWLNTNDDKDMDQVFFCEARETIAIVFVENDYLLDVSTPRAEKQYITAKKTSCIEFNIETRRWKICDVGIMLQKNWMAMSVVPGTNLLLCVGGQWTRECGHERNDVGSQDTVLMIVQMNDHKWKHKILPSLTLPSWGLWWIVAESLPRYDMNMLCYGYTRFRSDGLYIPTIISELIVHFTSVTGVHCIERRTGKHCYFTTRVIFAALEDIDDELENGHTKSEMCLKCIGSRYRTRKRGSNTQNSLLPI